MTRGQIKRDGGRRWSRSVKTGFVRPQRKFHKAKMRLYRQLQKGLRQQMAKGLQNAGLGAGVTAAEDGGLEVKEIL
jgi:hypothetical protein